MPSSWLLAQDNNWPTSSENGPISTWDLVLMVLVALVFFGITLLLVTRYKRCPSNRVLVVHGQWTGSPTGMKIIHDGARLILPLVQDYGYLSLEPIQIEIPWEGASPTEASTPCIFTVAIGTDPATLQNAAVRLLGLDTNEIRQLARGLIVEQLQQVRSALPSEARLDRAQILHQVQTALEPKLQQTGLVLIHGNKT